MKQHPFWKSSLELQSSAIAGANRSQGGIIKTRLNLNISDKMRLEVHNGATAGARQ